MKLVAVSSSYGAGQCKRVVSSVDGFANAEVAKRRGAYRRSSHSLRLDVPGMECEMFVPYSSVRIFTLWHETLDIFYGSPVNLLISASPLVAISCASSPSSSAYAFFTCKGAVSHSLVAVEFRVLSGTNVMVFALFHLPSGGLVDLFHLPGSDGDFFRASVQLYGFYPVRVAVSWFCWCLVLPLSLQRLCCLGYRWLGGAASHGLLTGFSRFILYTEDLIAASVFPRFLFARPCGS